MGEEKQEGGRKEAKWMEGGVTVEWRWGGESCGTGGRGEMVGERRGGKGSVCWMVERGGIGCDEV